VSITWGIAIFSDNNSAPVYVHLFDSDITVDSWLSEHERQLEIRLRYEARIRKMTEEEFADIFVKTKKIAKDMTVEERCERLTLLQETIKTLRGQEQAVYQAETESLEGLSEEEKEKHIAAVKSFTEKASSPKARAERKKKDSTDKLVDLFVATHGVSKEEAVKMIAAMNLENTNG
jgi:hypothetical protein